MGVTALGLLLIVVVNCVIMTQKKSKSPSFLPFFIRLFPHLFRKFFWGASYESSTGHSFMGQTELGLVDPVLRSLEPAAEGISTNSSSKS